MPTSLTPSAAATLLGKLVRSNQRFTTAYPGDRIARQPLHTVYGGAQLFKATTPSKLGKLALAHLREYAPDARALALAVGLEGGIDLAEAVYSRVIAKLEREPVEDFRIDFEDGFGIRSDAEEDAEAERTAREVAFGMRAASLPAFLGIRVKSLSEQQKHRAVRTLDLFLTTLLEANSGTLPQGFVVTLPKVVSVAQVKTLVRVLEQLEQVNALAAGTLKLELMIEVGQALFDHRGRSLLPLLARAAKGRCVAVHFGTYDYTASLGIAAPAQHMTHPSCEFAKQLMLVAFSGSGVRLSDGATNILPTPPHRGDSLTPEELAENRRVVHGAWRVHYANVRHSLAGGFYQGWDLHPGQLPIRYAASFAFFLEGLELSTERLKHFVGEAARASLVGNVFDDAATGQGLLNYFLRAYAAGAIDAADLARTGLTEDELGARSFLAILQARNKV